MAAMLAWDSGRAYGAGSVAHAATARHMAEARIRFIRKPPKSSPQQAGPSQLSAAPARVSTFAGAAAGRRRREQAARHGRTRVNSAHPGAGQDPGFFDKGVR
jgi:hypothetical protein